MVQLAITILGFGIALIIAGCIVWGMARVFNHGPYWAKGLTILFLATIFIGGIVASIIDSNNAPTYYYAESDDPTDRYR